MNISRRDFLKTSAIGAAGIAAIGLTGCEPSNNATNESASDSKEKPSIVKPDVTKTADICVVGLGASGIIAAAKAAQDGARVIAVEVASDINGTTNCRTSGAWAVGSSFQRAVNSPLTLQVAFDYMSSETHFQHNLMALKNILEATGKAVDLLTDGGMQWIVGVKAGQTLDEDYMALGGHRYGLKDKDRGAVFQNVLDKTGVKCIYNTRANALITKNGVVTGVQCDMGGKVLHVQAKNVILCSGGFLNNPEMFAKYFGGAKCLNIGSPNSNGDGINMAQAAGGQMGKNFAVSLNEYGGANDKATPKYAFRHNIGENETFRIAILGGLLVNNNGVRFINEGNVAEKAMFTSEPMLRESSYYCVVDDEFMEKIATTPISDMMALGHVTPDAARVQGMLKGVTLTDIKDQFDKAVKEGWAYKADTLAEIAKHFKMENLESTVKEYNTFCENGEDLGFYKNPAYLTPVKKGPFYVAQYFPSAWLSLGGIKTDGFCQVVNKEDKRIPGLYACGADADIYSTPYFQGGSANGQALGSGYVAGEAAAKNI